MYCSIIKSSRLNCGTARVALDILEMDIFVADYLAIFFARVNGNRLQVSLNFCSLAPAFAAFSVTTGFQRYATFTPKHNLA